MSLSGNKYVASIGIELDWAAVHVPFKKEVVVLAGDKFGMSQRILKLHDCLYVVLNEAICVKN